MTHAPDQAEAEPSAGGELVALHTQSLRGAAAKTYLSLLSRVLGAARLNHGFPDRRRLQATLEGLEAGLDGFLYPELLLDSRTGLPNLAALTRVRTDHEIAPDALSRLHSEHELRQRIDESEVFADLLARRAYLERMAALDPATVDEHRVQVRRHDPASGTASFRLETTKLDAGGTFMRLVIELTQVSSTWRRRAINLDEAGESANAEGDFRAMIYRWAGYDAETLFVHLHEIEGVSVERVERGVIGPATFEIGDADAFVTPLQGAGAFGRMAAAFAQTSLGLADPRAPRRELLLCAHTDVAAPEIREEKSNDPLSPLMSARIQDGERARYDELRRRFAFKVYKDCKFVATPRLSLLAKEVAKAAGTKNIVYPVAVPAG